RPTPRSTLFPYTTLFRSLLISAKSGVSVKLIVPDKSDSKLVNAAACSYYEAMLKSGVEIYRYKKGFVHAKTLVIDDEIAVVGTANMDVRSFDLNFEVNAIIYDEEIANQLQKTFYEDLISTEKIELEQWQNRSVFYKFLDKLARLFSPML